MVKSIIIFLTFNGNCSEALTFYEKAFGAKIIEKTTYGEAEMSKKKSDDNLVMNSTFLLGGYTFSGYDSLIPTTYNNNNLSIWLEIDSEKSLLYIYNELLENSSKIVVPLEESFWSSKYAKLSDKYGITWELNFQQS